MSALREILAVFGVEFNSGPLVQGNAAVDGMIGKLEGLGKAVAGAFGLHEIKAWYDSLTEGAIKLQTQAETIGMSAEQLQLWQYAAERSHISADGFSMSLNRLQSQLFQAAQGNAGISKMFSRVGLSAKDAQGNVKDVGEFLDDFAAKVSTMTNEGEKKQLVKMLFGRGGFRLLPLLNKGAEGIKQLKTEFQALGGGFTPEFIEQSEKVESAQKRVKRVFTALSIQLLNKFMPYVEKAAHFVEGLVRKLTDLQKSGTLTRGIMSALTVVLIANLPRIIGMVMSLARALTLPNILFVAAILLVDELITTFQGGQSYITDFLDNMFGEGTTQRIVANIKTIASEVSGLMADFDSHAGKASDLSLGILAVIQTIGLVFDSTFSVLEATGRVVWRMLGDLQAVLENVAVAAAKVLKFVGLYGGEVGTARKFSSDSDYANDIDKSFGSTDSRINDLVKTFSAMGNQTVGAAGPTSVGAALAAAGETRPDVAAFMSSQSRPSVTTTVQQNNTFNMAAGSTKEQAKEVAGAVDEANKASYRAADALLVHKVESG